MSLTRYLTIIKVLNQRVLIWRNYLGNLGFPDVIVQAEEKDSPSEKRNSRGN